MAAYLLIVFLVATRVVLLNAQGSPSTTYSSCSEINRVMTPCAAYLANRALHPSIMCCMGTASVRRMAAVADQDRQAACECLKSLSSQFIGLDPTRAARLPGICGVHVGFPITSNVNCSNIPPL